MFQNISHSHESCAKLRQIDFNDFALNADDMLSSAIHIFTELGLLRKFNIEYEVSCHVYYISKCDIITPSMGICICIDANIQLHHQIKNSGVCQFSREIEASIASIYLFHYFIILYSVSIKRDYDSVNTHTGDTSLE